MRKKVRALAGILCAFMLFTNAGCSKTISNESEPDVSDTSGYTEDSSTIDMSPSEFSSLVSGESGTSGDSTPSSTISDTGDTVTSDLYNPRIVRPELLYGVCENLIDRSEQMGLNTSTTISALKALGCKSIRIIGMQFNGLLSSPTGLSAYGEKVKSIIKLCRMSSIEVTICGCGYIMPGSWTQSNPSYDSNSYPYRDLQSDSEYMQFLNNLRQSYATLAKEFTGCYYWELLNEPNGDVFFHPASYVDSKKNVFSTEEKMAIITDMMYYATQGIHEGNKNALSVMPSWAPLVNGNASSSFSGIAECIESIYTNIETGKWPSTSPDDFFQVGCWHAYDFASDMSYADPADGFVAKNQMVYEVMKKHGDDGKKVIITEFGYTDYGNSELDTKYADYMQRAYALTKSELPFIETINYYRLWNDASSASWGAEGEEYNGLFKELSDGFVPKQKAITYQQMSGGSGNLNTVFTGVDASEIKSGDNAAYHGIVTASSSCEHPGWGWCRQYLVDGETKNTGWSVWYDPTKDAPWALKTKAGCGTLNETGPEWVQVALPGDSTFTINKIVVYGGWNKGSNSYLLTPVDWQVQVSADGVNYTTVGEVADHNDTSRQIFEFSFSAQEVKYIRVNITKLRKYNDPAITFDNYIAQFAELQALVA